MEIETKLHITKIMSEMIGEPLVYGSNDCNLMVLKMYEPDKHDEFVGRYKTVIGGARVAKKLFGYARIDDYMEKSERYEQVPKNFMRYGDIVFSDHDHTAMVALGINRVFAISPLTNTFVECAVNIPDNYKIFRRV